ncbi:adenosylcobinamide-GDP ribazoletransferase [Gordonia liuliyuniae]|uniref:Adenosylcobinamide-GDP ribazoletransferase n=1 Tax=Gordonia liuliyuniae TaxID=2911517 RepID=A0ABS9IUU8_9ACTN|nr:adenosylcobinamide-GDP ribazoletransferase [Gordonia liuliyuniae]MCF8589338.1 adenosylcobinamide-GDP ribazoletransferase [Gordonia liuliyuniae]
MGPASAMGRNPLTAVHVAVSWLTVAPVPAPRVEMDRSTGGAVIATVPLVGALLGGVAAAAAYGLSRTELPDLLVGVLIVALLALTTRGMHVDGLADTADGLGCYGDADRIREVMRSGDVGPFGAATLAIVLGAQSVAFGALAADERWWQAGFAVALARVAVVYVCRAGLPPANSNGFGALVAGTARWSILVWTILAVGAAWPLGTRALCAVAAVAVFSVAFSAHCRRRMGGVSGDVLGAVIELSTALTLVILCA